jgi:hypothetical protein
LGSEQGLWILSMRQRHGTSQSMLAMRDYWSAAQIMARSRIRNVHQAQRSQDLQCYRWAISAPSISQAERFAAKPRVLGKFLDFSREGNKRRG